MAVFKNIYSINPIHWDIWTYRLFKFLNINLSEFLIDETLGKCYSHLVAWLKIWIHALTIRTPRNKKHLHPINSKPTFLHALSINSQKILFFSRIVSVLLTQLVYTCCTSKYKVLYSLTIGLLWFSSLTYTNNALLRHHLATCRSITGFIIGR